MKMSLEAPSDAPRKEEIKPVNERREQETFIKPELTVGFQKEVLDSLAQQYPEHREMFERFASLPPIKLERGKVNFIFGPNGCGKSTLANAIFLEAQVSQRARLEMDEKHNIFFADSRPASPEEARQLAIKRTLHPGTMSRYNLAEIVGMAAAPRLVEDGALTLSEFQVREGFGYSNDDSLSDTPVIHRIAIQDLLGEKRRSEEDYLFERGGAARKRFEDDYEYQMRTGDGKTTSAYAESGASSRQMINERLRQEFERINPGSIVVIDELTYGLSPKRQEDYIKMVEKFAQEKELIVISPENSGYAYDSASTRIDLRAPEAGLHQPESQNDQARTDVAKIESRENLPEPTTEFIIDKEKTQDLAQKNPKFKSMLELFAKLPASVTFGHGKTEIFADNACGKTTMLGVMYLLTQVEKSIKDTIRFEELFGRKSKDVEELRDEWITHNVTNPSQSNDKVFIESLGLARELITSGAITIGKHEEIPEYDFSTESDSVIWMNLLDMSGIIKHDNLHMIGSAETNDADILADKIKARGVQQNHGSTRQTAEAVLFQTIQKMPEGGFLFVDEIDGGISPDRQLHISDTMHKLAQERKITIISTSNSWLGEKYRLTPSIDLSTPEQGVSPATHKILETTQI